MSIIVTSPCGRELLELEPAELAVMVASTDHPPFFAMTTLVSPAAPELLDSSEVIVNPADDSFCL
jgi:hypothetical protein